MKDFLAIYRGHDDHGLSLVERSLRAPVTPGLFLPGKAEEEAARLTAARTLMAERGVAVLGDR